jgi:hypothetical protein
MEVGFNDIVHLCRVEEPEGWVTWLSLRVNGIYAKEMPGDVFHEVRQIIDDYRADRDKRLRDWKRRKDAGYRVGAEPAAWSGDLTKPLLRLPCPLEQLQWFLEDAGLYGCLDPFAMAAWMSARSPDGSDDGEAGGRPTTDDAAPMSLTAAAGAAQRRETRVRRALVRELQAEWPSIEKDLTEGSRNGLTAAAHDGKAWDLERARDWARQRGKLRPPPFETTRGNPAWPGNIVRKRGR